MRYDTFIKPKYLCMKCICRDIEDPLFLECFATCLLAWLLTSKFLGACVTQVYRFGDFACFRSAVVYPLQSPQLVPGEFASSVLPPSPFAKTYPPSGLVLLLESDVHGLLIIVVVSQYSSGDAVISLREQCSCSSISSGTLLFLETISIGGGRSHSGGWGENGDVYLLSIGRGNVSSFISWL